MDGGEKQTLVWAPALLPQRRAGGWASVSRAHLPLDIVFVKTQEESLTFPVHLVDGLYF